MAYEILVKCPYYRREERNPQKKIVCEGIVTGTSLHQIFPTVEELKKHKKCCCMGDYNSCPVAQMLNRKYDYEA